MGGIGSSCTFIANLALYDNSVFAQNVLFLVVKQVLPLGTNWIFLVRNGR